MLENQILNHVLHWEECICDWCGSSEQEQIFRGPDRLEKLPGIFCLVRCTGCGTYRQNPRLTWESLTKYYPDDYISYSYDVANSKNSWRRYIKDYGNRKRRRIIESFQPGGNLLEIGCGTGGFLRELSKSGKWKLTGIEPSEVAANFASNSTSAKIIRSRLSDVSLDRESFDAIVLWTVIEHLSHPIRDLEYIASLIKPNGWLLFSIPNLESVDAKIFRQYWSGWDLPRHLYLFPRGVVRDVMSSMGFRIAKERCISTSYAGLGHSLEFWSQLWEHKYPRTKDFIKRIYHSWITRVSLLIPLAILDRLNLTSTITFIEIGRA